MLAENDLDYQEAVNELGDNVSLSGCASLGLRLSQRNTFVELSLKFYFIDRNQPALEQ